MQRINEESTYISNHPKQQWLNLTADRRCAVEQWTRKCQTALTSQPVVGLQLNWLNPDRCYF